MLVSLLGLIALLLCLFIGLPIAWAMLLVGVAGLSLFAGMDAALSMAAQLSFDTVMSYSFTVLPLFILMGNLLSASRITDRIVRLATAVTGSPLGWVAQASILSWICFPGMAGSAVAAAAATGAVASRAPNRAGPRAGPAAALPPPAATRRAVPPYPARRSPGLTCVTSPRACRPLSLARSRCHRCRRCCVDSPRG